MELVEKQIIVEAHVDQTLESCKIKFFLVEYDADSYEELEISSV
jgi:hypothetical protein